MPNVSGNSAVIELLEAYLEVAKYNDFGHIAIAMVGHPNVAATDFAGDIALELSTREALGILTGKVQKSIDDWSLPPRDESLDASYVCYNVANAPLGFDFLIWLVDQEMMRRRENAPGPLKVGFWLGLNEGRINCDQRRMWLNKVFRPLLPMIGAVEDSTAIHGRHKEVYVPRDIVAAVNRGESAPRLRSVCQTKTDQAVTITLREAAHWSHRNSNLEAWLRFARDLRASGESVIFVRDTDKANVALEDFKTDPIASVDLDRRMALYESAKANLFVSNGPVGLALFGDRPWLQFVPVEDDSNPKYGPNTRKSWKDLMGIEIGGQFPWCAPDQRIVWLVDSYDNICAAWQALGLSPAVSRAA